MMDYGRSCHTKWPGVWRAGLAGHKLPVSQQQGSNTGQEALARPTWNPHGTHMELTWNPHGSHMEPSWNQHGTHMEFKRSPEGTSSWNSKENANGTQMQLTWNKKESAWKPKRNP